MGAVGDFIGDAVGTVADVVTGDIGGVLGAGASLAGGIMGANAAEDAANAQARAARDAGAVQLQMFNQARADNEPFREIGLQNFRQLSDLFSGGFQTSPGYQFRLSEGQKAINALAARDGNLNSGRTMNALAQYNQGLASDEFNQYANRLAALAGVGQTATQQNNALSIQNGQAQANALLNQGQARASGIVGGANAVSGGINNAITLGAMMGGFGGAGNNRQIDLGNRMPWLQG